MSCSVSQPHPRTGSLLQGSTFLLVFLSLQAASGPRAFCVPQIVLTECTPSSPTLPEATLEELGPRTVPTPRPRTLAGSGKAWNGPQALLGLAAEVLWPRSSSASGKEPATLQSPRRVEARVLCLRGPSPDETRKTFTVETHSEETPQDSVCDTEACGRGPQAISSGGTVQDATLLRMDSLEETLQQLEATLSEMGAKSTMPWPGSPQPLRPHPQVAAIPLSSPAPPLDRRSSAHLPHPTVYVSAYHARGASVQAKAYGQSQGRPGSRPTQDSALRLRHDQVGSVPVCSLSAAE